MEDQTNNKEKDKPRLKDVLQMILGVFMTLPYVLFVLIVFILRPHIIFPVMAFLYFKKTTRERFIRGFVYLNTIMYMVVVPLFAVALYIFPWDLEESEWKDHQDRFKHFGIAIGVLMFYLCLIHTLAYPKIIAWLYPVAENPEKCTAFASVKMEPQSDVSTLHSPLLGSS